MTRFLLVCAGGAAGTGARYLMQTWAIATFGDRFPWGTLAVNALGSFVIALIMRLSLPLQMNDTLRITLTVGVLGGFTTYSSFNNETMTLAVDGHLPRAAAYLVGTVALCLVAGALGLVVGRLCVGD